MKQSNVSIWISAVLSIFIILTGCGTQQAQPAQPDYNSVKSMVLDIMQTEDAKKSITRILQTDSIKSQLMMDTETVRSTLMKTMASPDNTHLKEAFKDPKFASTLAKSLKEEQKKLMKDLMKDPEFQKMMVDLLKDPEFEKNQLQLMKSAAYRQQTMQIMKESLQSPLFQEDLMKIMTKVTEEMVKPKEKKKDGGQGGGGESGGGSGESS